jgi:photosystem II stability/assembly factor-like uncharacterized protein
LSKRIKSHDNKKKIENKDLEGVRDVNEIFEDERVFEARAEWYRILRGDIEDDVIQQRRIKEIDRATKIHRTGLVGLPGLASLEEFQHIWVPMGPNNINGRIKSLAIHPTDENVLYAGGADGGVWKTTDGGKSWFSTMETELSMAIGAIGICEGAPNVVYAATGEDAPGGSPAFPGVGVYKTSDGGNDWDLLSPILSTRCTRVLVSSSNPNTVYVAGNQGLHKSVDGGTSWTNIRTDHVSDAVMDPDDPNIIYAGVWKLGVFKTTDGGSTWTLLSDLPTGPGANWIKLAMGPRIQIAPVQFLVAKMGLEAGQMYKTTNAGSNWTPILAAHGTGQNTWNNLVAVDPTNQDVIFAGGQDLERSDDGGASFSQIGGTHPDHHVLVFSPTNHNVCYLTTDGGVYKSKDNGISWTLSSTGLVCTQLYGLDVSQTSPLAIGCGTQDQGFIKSDGSSDWNDTHGGNEGNNFIIDPNNSNNMYITPWSGFLRRSTDGGSTWTNILHGIGNKVVRHIAVQPGDSNILLAAVDLNNVFRSTNQGNNWELVLTTDVISVSTKTTCVIFSSYNPAECYATTNDGQIYRSDSNGISGSWYKPYDSAHAPAVGGITCISVASNVVYIGYGSGAKIYKSTDGGKQWKSASGVLPTDSLQGTIVNAIVIDQHNSEVVYATTDIGIFRTPDGGESWHLYDDGMPRIVTTGLALRKNTNTLYAGTLGRGVYKRVLSERVVLATISNIVAVSAHYAGEIDQHLHAVVGTSNGKVHEIYWIRDEEPGQGVIFQFLFGSIVDLAAYYGGEIDQNQHVIVGTTDGKIHELNWQGPDPPSHDVLTQFAAGSIVAIAAFYGGGIDQHQHVIVGTKDGNVHELFWQGPDPATVRVLSGFGAGNIVDIAGYYNPADQNQHAIVATKDGNMHELFWQTGGQPGEGILTQFLTNNVGVTAYYNPTDQFERLIVGAKNGKVYEEYWQGTDPLSEGVLTQFDANSIVGLDMFHVANYLPQHLIVATTDGKIHWLTETVVQ